MFEHAGDVASMMVLSVGAILLLWVAVLAMYELILALAWFWFGIVALGAGSTRGFVAAAWAFGLSWASWAVIVASLSGTATLMPRMSAHPILALAAGPVIWGLLLVALRPVRKYRDSKLEAFGYNVHPWSAREVSSPGHA